MNVVYILQIFLLILKLKLTEKVYAFHTSNMQLVGVTHTCCCTLMDAATWVDEGSRAESLKIERQLRFIHTKNLILNFWLMHHLKMCIRIMKH